MKVGFTAISHNRKTGPIPTSVTEKKSCPDKCPYKRDKLCYPFFGPLGFIWEGISTDNGKYNVYSWDEFCNKVASLPVGQIWRHNVAGDLPGVNGKINEKQLKQLVIANKKKKGFTYTHKPLTKKNVELIRYANKYGFVVNISVDTISDVDKYWGIAPIVITLPTDAPKKIVTPKGHKIIACLADRGTNCSLCGLCARKRNVAIGFYAHGVKKKSVDVMLSSLTKKTNRV